MGFYLHKGLSHQGFLAFLKMGRGVEAKQTMGQCTAFQVFLSHPPSKLHHKCCCP